MRIAPEPLFLRSGFDADGPRPEPWGPKWTSFDKALVAVVGLGPRYGPVEPPVAVDPFYKSPEWRDFRAKFRKKHPICCVPGCGKPTSHVDHKLSRKKGGEPLDERNCQPLCWSHHSQKTAKKDGGFGNPHQSGTSGFSGCDASGRPLDPDHHWNRKR